MKIEKSEEGNYKELIEIWERSVRATHDFLNEDDILDLKPLILNQYFDAVDLQVAKDEDETIVGFCGVHEGNIEMLFIDPDSRGNGVGSRMVAHAVKCQGATKVDVNEQNIQAVGFYKHVGFTVIGRSPLDGQGKPYPLLHMVLSRKTAGSGNSRNC